MELSLADLRDLLAPPSALDERTVHMEPTTLSVSSALDELVGRNVFVRTVTHHHTGRLAAVDQQFLTLDDAAWIADDGRFSDALANGTLNEVEPFPGRCYVSVGSLIDVCEWTHDLPRVQK
jgi:hypothetical protein